MDLMRIMIATGKGGTGKTTTAVHLAAILSELEPPVALVDLDLVQLLARAWVEQAQEEDQAWARDIVLVETTPRTVERDLKDWTGSVVIDTAGGDFQTLSKAAGSVDLLLGLVRPTRMEVEALGDTAALFDAVTSRTPGVKGIYAVCQPTPGSRSAKSIHEALRGNDYSVVRTTIPRRESIAQSYGTAPDTRGPFLYLYEELKGM